MIRRLVYLLLSMALTASALSHSVQMLRRGARRRKGEYGFEPMGFYDMANDTAYFYTPAKPIAP